MDRTRRLTAFPPVASAAAAVIAGLALVGWWLDIAVLRSAVPDRVSMNPMTAVAFLLAAAALWLQRGEPVAPGRRLAAQLCASGIAVVAGLVVGHYVFGLDVAIDRTLFAGKLDLADAIARNRMAPNTAASFLCLAGAALLLDARRPVGRWCAQLLTLFVGLTGLVAILGYGYASRQLYGIGPFIPMALNTAVAFLLLAAGLLATRPRRGLLARIMSSGPGGMLTRRLLPAMLVPVGLGWLWLAGQRHGFYDTELGVALMVTLTVALLTGLLWRTGVLLDGTDVQRRRAEHDLQRTHDELERRVVERTAALRRTTEELRQAQKMEAVGRLAGGIAHDFNNVLTIIHAETELLLMEAVEGDPQRANILEIQSAVKRAAMFTHQLLAFSRQQILQPKAIDLNAVVAEMEPLLRRLTGEDVVLGSKLDAALSPVWADPGQLGQILLNLAANARDAMPSGGTLTIETANVELDEHYPRDHPTSRTGPHVMLAVTDTGCGMDAGTQTRIFEPFYTTKELGKGTGLGLSTVYGIVKQSGGHIWVYSEVGRGTTFKIYFPPHVATDGVVESAATQPATAQASVQNATILLVEDEPAVRRAVRRLLERYGYRVLEAPSGGDALELAARHVGPIDLMLSDMVMPGMSAAELVGRLRELRPAVPILLMTGYTQEAVMRAGGSGLGVGIIEKPFTLAKMLEKVSETLNGSLVPS